MTIHPALGMLLVGGSFAALIAGLRVLRDARAADPELLRKLLHVGMGGVSLTLPWLFDTPWPVLLLAGAFGAGPAGGPVFRVAGGAWLEDHLRGPADLGGRSLLPRRRGRRVPALGGRHDHTSASPSSP